MAARHVKAKRHGTHHFVAHDARLDHIHRRAHADGDEAGAQALRSEGASRDASACGGRTAATRGGRGAPTAGASACCPGNIPKPAATASPATRGATPRQRVCGGGRGELATRLVVRRQLGGVDDCVAPDVGPHARPQPLDALGARDDAVRRERGGVFARRAALAGGRKQGSAGATRKRGAAWHRLQRSGARTPAAACPPSACGP